MSSVVITDSPFPDLSYERGLLEEAGFTLSVAESRDPDAIARAGAGATGLLVSFADIDATLLDRLPSVRAIGRFGVGVDMIDIDAATRRGIPIVHSGNYATEEVALHTVALALAALRRLPAGERAVRSGRWNTDQHYRGMRRPSSLRAGVVGLGRIGQLVASQLQALGFDVEGFDPFGAPDDVKRAATLDELLERSDLVTLHLPLSDETRSLLDARRLALLPAGATVVNAARGGLIDQVALTEALDSGHLGAAALDVFADEPLTADHPLTRLEQVILSPHVAYFSEEAMLELRSRTVTGLLAALRGETPTDLANPAAVRASRP